MTFKARAYHGPPSAKPAPQKAFNFKLIADGVKTLKKAGWTVVNHAAVTPQPVHVSGKIDFEDIVLSRAEVFDFHSARFVGAPREVEAVRAELAELILSGYVPETKRDEVAAWVRLQLNRDTPTEDRKKHDPLRQERANAVGAELRVIERWEAHEAGE